VNLSVLVPVHDEGATGEYLIVCAPDRRERFRARRP
jgi:hypothetical protein